MKTVSTSNKFTKCHSEHAKVYPNGKLKITVTVPPEDAVAVTEMAKAYTDDGEYCVAKFIYWAAKIQFQEMLKAAEELKREEEDAKKQQDS